MASFLFMDTIHVLSPDSLGYGFIDSRWLPEGQDEYYLRDAQSAHRKTSWRRLHAKEIEILVRNGNTAGTWDDIRVADPFDPRQILHNSFYGLVRIGSVDNSILEHHDLRLPVGITNSTIVSCDIGNHVAIHHVRYLAHYIVEDRCILTNVDEMNTTDHAKFGNGIIKEGESEDVRVALDLINEVGSRAVWPFDGMTPADAYLWARYRDDERLMHRLEELTQSRFDARRGYYGTVGEQAVIKNCRILKDVVVGPHAYIKGANKLKNLTINSSAEEPTQIGEGVELVNGIIGFGCRVFYGCKAVRFIMGTNSSLKYGARLIHSFLGDNSTISCCEVLNNLIFPAHEQHHNNSFLVAALLLGQTNVAAGATIGSNHNSRANDNEIRAGRGFWPGLNVSLKHSSRFASFVLIAKGSYPAELDIRFPFSLISNNIARDRLEVIPAFWWLYNMYALIRNSWKFGARDTRRAPVQRIEFEALAPDSVEEIIDARATLREWADAAGAPPATGGGASRIPPELSGRGMEHGRREEVILHADAAYEAYTQMLHYYAAGVLLAWMEAHPEADYAAMADALAAKPAHDGADPAGNAAAPTGPGAIRCTEWENLGGQLVPLHQVDRLRRDIASGALDSWDAVHARYEELWAEYPTEKARHGWAVYRLLQAEGAAPGGPDSAAWSGFLTEAVRLQELVRDRVYQSRKKDYDNPFRIATYRNPDEMNAALGTIDENQFVLQVREETEEFRRRVATVIERER